MPRLGLDLPAELRSLRALLLDPGEVPEVARRLGALAALVEVRRRAVRERRRFDRLVGVALEMAEARRNGGAR